MSTNILNNNSLIGLTLNAVKMTVSTILSGVLLIILIHQFTH